MNKTYTIVFFRVFDREWCEVFKETFPTDDLEFYKNKILIKTHSDCKFHEVIQFPGKDGKVLLKTGE